MFNEAAEAAEVVALQLERNAAPVARIAQRLQRNQPRFITTVARGSSDHAANYTLSVN